MSQIENPELRSRAAARKLKDKENLSLAEKLILAGSQETIVYDYKGIEIETLVPTQGELDKFLKLLSKWTSAEDEKKGEQAYSELCDLVAELIIDESITPELLKSGQLGVSFFPKFQNEILEYEKKAVNEVTAVKGFRRK